MKRFPWLRRRRSQPDLPLEPPIWLGNHSNGEYFHFQTPAERRLRRLILKMADENARRIGWDRREFLVSAMGMATSLYCINLIGCSDNSPSESGPGGRDASAGGAGGAGGASGGGRADSGADAGFCVPEEAMFEPDTACQLLSGNEFIFDIQTHHFDPEGEWTEKNPGLVGFLGGSISDAGVIDIDHVAFDNYARQMFCESDTTMAALSTWPAQLCTPAVMELCGLPLPNRSVAESRNRLNQEAHNTQRLVNHCQIMPNDPFGLENQLDIMEQIYCEFGVAAWKMYPAWGPDLVGYFLDEELGRPVVEKGLSLGVNVFCVHKGLPIPGFDVEHNQPRDIGVVAKDYPDGKFIVYHSGICSGAASCSAVPTEGPYDESAPAAMLTGADQLVRSVIDNGIEPNGNVYAELGSAFSRVASDPTAAAHFLGKLMKYLGTDNVCWGTDAVLGGRSPQGLIEQFRMATIPQSMQDQYGYPALDQAQKEKILGLNAAAAYGIDAEAARCALDRCDQTARLRRQPDEEGGRQWAVRAPVGPKTWKEYIEHAKRAKAQGRPG